MNTGGPQNDAGYLSRDHLGLGEEARAWKSEVYSRRSKEDTSDSSAGAPSDIAVSDAGTVGARRLTPKAVRDQNMTRSR